MRSRRVFSTVLVLALTGVALMALSQRTRGQTDAPIPNVVWQLKDSISACPGGDSVVAGRPARLRNFIEYDDAIGDPRAGVPPESIWVTYSTTDGNVAVNDQEPGKVYAEYYTDANGVARITLPSLSGSGTLRLALYVSGVYQGARNVQIRSTDANADGRTTPLDLAPGVDIDWIGGVTPADLDTIGNHLDQWHRNALHGGMVQVTNLCGTCVPGAVNTFGGGPFWSPSGRILSYTRFVQASPTPACKIFISPSDSAMGHGAFQVTFDPPADHDYDPGWTPAGDAIVFDRADTSVIRRGVPWSGDQTEVTITSSALAGDLSPSVSPDGQWVAYSRPDGGAAIWKIRMNGDALSRTRLSVGFVPNIVDYDEYPSWSPDGQWVYFMRTFHGGKIAVYKVPADSGTAIAVSPDPLAPDSIYTLAQSVSSDGKLVIFGRGKIKSPTKQVFAHTLDPTVTPVTSKKPVVNYRDTLYAGGGPKGLGVGLRLSPDGTRLAVGSRQVWAARRNMNLPPHIDSLHTSCCCSQSLADSIVQVVVQMRMGQMDSVTVYASDPEGDALTYDAPILPLGATFNQVTRALAWDKPLITGYGVLRVTTASGGTDAVVLKLTPVGYCSPRSESSSLRAANEDAPGLIRIGPNPTRGSFVFPGVAARSGTKLSASVFDLAGRRVAVVKGRPDSPLVWDGKGHDGRAVQPGIYLYRLESGALRQEGKVVVVR